MIEIVERLKLSSPPSVLETRFSLCVCVLAKLNVLLEYLYRRTARLNEVYSILAWQTVSAKERTTQP